MFHSEANGWDYKFIEIIGKGSFGKVYRVEDPLGKPAAVKIISSAKSAKREYKILNLLDDTEGVPRVFRFYNNDGLYAISMEYVGVNIFSKESGLDFSSIRELAKFAYSALRILKRIHSKGIVHNDIKPHQFLIDQLSQYSLVDFGFAQQFKTRKHHKEIRSVKYREGNFLFASINCHKDLSLSRRDDLCSLGYMLVFLYRGSLPWEKFASAENSMEKWARTLEMKEGFSIEMLCDGMPEEFRRLLEHAYGLEFKQKPNYRMFIRSFRELYKESPKIREGTNNSLGTEVTIRKNALMDFYSQLDETEVIGAPEVKNRYNLH
jgi:serine/threonine protein kinase